MPPGWGVSAQLLGLHNLARVQLGGITPRGGGTAESVRTFEVARGTGGGGGMLLGLSWQHPNGGFLSPGDNFPPVGNISITVFFNTTTILFHMACLGLLILRTRDVPHF